MAFHPLDIRGILLETLRGQYYYNRFGMDVKQKLGEKISYWQYKVPDMLQEALESRDMTLIEPLYEHLRQLTRDQPSRQTLMRNKMQHAWPYSETILDISLKSILLYMHQAHLDEAFESLIPNSEFDGLTLGGYSPIPNGMSEPDMILSDANSTIIIEIKVAQGARQYPASQLLRYLELVKYLRHSDDDFKKIKSVYHLILLPTQDPRWFESPNLWILDNIGDDPLQIEAEVLKKASRKDIPLKKKEVDQYLGEIPILVRSWMNIYDAFNTISEINPVILRSLKTICQDGTTGSSEDATINE